MSWRRYVLTHLELKRIAADTVVWLSIYLSGVPPHGVIFRRGSLTSIPGFSWSQFNLVVFEDVDERRSIEMQSLSCWQKSAGHPETPLLSHQPRLKILSLPVFSTLCASRGVNVSAGWPQVRYQDRNNLMEEDRGREGQGPVSHVES